MKRQEFINALSAVKPGLAAKELIEQSTTFVFKGGRVFTYNDEVSVSHSIDVDFEGAITAKSFLAYISKLKTDEISLTLSEDESELLVKAKRAKSGFTLDAEIKLPFDDIIIEDDAWQELPKDFLKGLQFSRAIPSSDMSDPVLTCVHINNGRIEATDRYRVTNFVFDEDNSSALTEMLLPAYTLGHIISMKPVEVQIQNEWAHFSNKAGTILSCRTFEGEYPDITPFLKKPGDTYELPAALADTLSKASIFSMGMTIQDTIIDVSFTNNKLIISSKSDEGWFKESLKANYKGDAVSFTIAHYLLQSIVKDVNTFLFDGNLLTFTKDNWIYSTSATV